MGSILFPETTMPTTMVTTEDGMYFCAFERKRLMQLNDNAMDVHSYHLHYRKKKCQNANKCRLPTKGSITFEAFISTFLLNNIWFAYFYTFVWYFLKLKKSLQDKFEVLGLKVLHMYLITQMAKSLFLSFCYILLNCKHILL